MTVSLVEVAPSVIRQLKVASVARARIGWSSAGVSAASVVRKASIVAMLGASIPHPLAIPPTVKPSPRTTASLGRVSVVRMPLAASRPPLARQRLAKRRDRAQNLAHRQAVSDQPGRADQHVAAVAADRRRRRVAHRLGVGAALGPGPGIGIARIDDDARRHPRRGGEPLDAGVDRRRAKLVGGEHGRGRHRLAVVGRQQRGVAPLGLDPGGEPGGDETLRRQ